MRSPRVKGVVKRFLENPLGPDPEPEADSEPEEPEAGPVEVRRPEPKQPKSKKAGWGRRYG